MGRTGRGSARRTKWFAACLGALLGCVWLGSAALADGLRFITALEPRAMEDPEEASVRIVVGNAGDCPVAVMLYDPFGEICASFGSGGTANIAPGAFADYEGVLEVTESQLDSGEALYSVRYVSMDEGGPLTPVTQGIPLKVRRKETPHLRVSRTFTPSGGGEAGDADASTPPSMHEGERVTIAYTLTNTGAVDISGITLADPGVLAYRLVYPLLRPGESVRLSYALVAGKASVVTDPVFTFEDVDTDGTAHTRRGAVGSALIAVRDAETGLSFPVPEPTAPSGTQSERADAAPVAPAACGVTLTASSARAGKGDVIGLICDVVNQGEVALEQLRFTDISTGDLADNITLEPGAAVRVHWQVQAEEWMPSHLLVLHGFDAAGRPVAFASNAVGIVVGDAAEHASASPVVEAGK